MAAIDWIIVFAITVGILGFAFWAKRFNRSVSDFLSANRCGGRYVLSVAGGMAVLGAISFPAESRSNSCTVP